MTRPVRNLDPSTLDLAIGGQAVIEGVMMRTPRAVATAVRTPSGKIVVRRQAHRSFVRRLGLHRILVLRGGLHLIESMSLGIRALLFSADQAMVDEELADRRTSWKDKLSLGGTLLFAFALSLLLFFYLPLLATEWTGVQSGFWFNVIDGILRLVVFLGYLLLISRLADMRRLFEYHGAEHKTIHVFENGLPLEPANAARFTTLHPRCGTSFLMFVMLISILVFMTLGKPEGAGERLLRLAFVPLIGGISYEFIKLSGKKAGASWMQPFIWPGLMLQRITTRPPSEDQVAVAMAALLAVLEAESSETVEDALLELSGSTAVS